jgi:hypothetical protein
MREVHTLESVVTMVTNAATTRGCAKVAQVNVFKGRQQFVCFVKGQDTTCSCFNLMDSVCVATHVCACVTFRSKGSSSWTNQVHCPCLNHSVCIGSSFNAPKPYNICMRKDQQESTWGPVATTIWYIPNLHCGTQPFNPSELFAFWDLLVEAITTFSFH